MIGPATPSQTDAEARMTKLAGEFKEFLLKQNALALAVGVIIGAAIGKVVAGLVEDLIMPIVGIALPGGDWRSAQVSLGGSMVKYGDFFGRIVDFAIIAAAVFFIVKALLKTSMAAATKACPECLEQIPVLARRCRACGTAMS